MQQGAYGVAVVGLGTVGGSVAREILQTQGLIKEKTGLSISLARVVELRRERLNELGLDPGLACDLDTALADEGVHVVVELVGGLGFAKQVIEKSLKASKAVVTANKALLAEHGTELFALARLHGSSISFEASCEGAVPVIRALQDGLAANRVDALYGIVNGTCNHILSAMTKKAQGYQAALKEAQASGLAEADPSLDVKGIDSAHKLTILSTLAFGKRVRMGSFPIQGIDGLAAEDIAYGKDLGYVIKLLAAAERRREGLSLRVRPHFIHFEHPLAWVSGAFNAVSVYGHSSGHSMYYGRGAGGLATSSAVIADIIQAGLGGAKLDFNTLRYYPDLCPEASLVPSAANRCRFYLRLKVADCPGVLGSLASILGKHGISIASALQPEAQEDGKGASVVITTHQALEGDMEMAIKEIEGLRENLEKSVLIPILDEFQEYQEPKV